MDCFRFTCPFRVNESTSMNRCECVACPNRTSDHTQFATNAIMPESDVKAHVYGQFTRDHWGPRLNVCYRDEGGAVIVEVDRDGVSFCDGLAYFDGTDGKGHRVLIEHLCSIVPL